MIINRYLIREISKPLVAVLGVLVVLFASYGAAGFLSDAVNGLLSTDTIAALIGLKTLISLEVLIPISLYISVVLALGRLYSESEITAMFALRVTPARVMGAVLTLSAVLALIVAGLSLSVRPWAYQRSHTLTRQAQASINFDDMEAGTFYEAGAGDRVVFIGQRVGPKTPAKNVFVQLKLDHKVQIIHARQASQLEGRASDGGPLIDLQDAHVYQLARDKTDDDRVLKARDMQLNLSSPAVEPGGYSSLAADSATLATSASTRDVAEFQWRLSTPLSTLLLGLLGVPLSRARPRQGRYAKMGTAILIYSGYYLLCTTARTWVQDGTVATFPGIWWAPALLALVLLLALSAPSLGFRFGR